MSREDDRIEDRDAFRKEGVIPESDLREMQRSWSQPARLDVSIQNGAGLWRIPLYFLWLGVFTGTILFFLDLCGMSPLPVLDLPVPLALLGVLLNVTTVKLRLRLLRWEYLLLNTTAGLGVIPYGVAIFLYHSGQ